MILISHRGNLNGKTDDENNPKYIEEALNQGFDVEVDVWYIDNQFWLGHDDPQYRVEEKYLENPKFWCHAKNIDGLYKMLDNSNIHCFFHQEDDVTLTSNGYMWTYPDKELTKKSICVTPETVDKSIDCYGVCTDFVTRWI